MARILLVIPTLGTRLDYLRQNLESLASQKAEPIDIVIVGPTKNNGIRKLAKEFNVTEVIEDPGGLSAAINAGLAWAKPHHKYANWLGDDDMLTKDSLKTTIAMLDKHPGAAAVYGYCDYIDKNGRRLFTNRAGWWAPWLMSWGPDLVAQPGMLMRLSALRKAGPLDENNKWCVDLELFLRLKKVGKFVNAHKTLAAFRWHDTSNTVGNRDLVLDETEQVKRRYMGQPWRSVAWLWERPVRWATKLAVRRVNKMAGKGIA